MSNKYVKAFTAIDPIDVTEGTSGEAQRKVMRVKILKGFLSWAYWKEP